MKKIIGLTILSFLFQVAIAFAAPSISNFNSETNVITCSGAGTNTDLTPEVWDDFEDNNFTDWDFFGGSNDSWSLTTSGTFAGSSYSAKKTLTFDDRLNYMSQNLTDSNFYIVQFKIRSFMTAVETPVQGYNLKLWRLWQQDGSGSSPTNIVWGGKTTGSLNQSILTVEFSQSNSGSATTDFGSSGTDISSFNGVGGDWADVRIEVVTPVDGETVNDVKAYVNGTLEEQLTGELWEVGWEIFRSAIGVLIRDFDGYINYDDVYMHTTRARVVIGDNATFSSCTKTEIQLLDSWADTSVELDGFNNGSFVEDDTAFLFIVDEDGAVSSGYEITIGGSGPTPTPSTDNCMTVSDVLMSDVVLG